MPMFWRDADRSPVTVQEAVGEWALAAWDVLETVAARWNRTVAAEDLGAEVQRRSGIATSAPSATWLGPMLSLVAQRAHESRGPALTSLVTGDDGRVYAGYREVLALQGRSAFDLDEHAREARMECHRAYGAKVPAGRTELPRKRTPGGAPAAAVKAAPPKPKVCPSCFLELPATGVCDDCD